MWRAIALALLGFALYGASPTRAGVVTRRERPNVKSGSLSQAERRAITVRSVSVAGDDSVGVVVRATFDGDISRYLGRGQLTNGLLALILVPRTGAIPAGLLDETGKHLLLITPARPAGVAVRGDQVIFYAGGVHLSRFARVELRVFVAAPAHPSWRQVLSLKPTERVALGPSASRLTCSELTTLASQLRVLHSRGFSAELGLLKAAGRTACAPPPPPPPPQSPPTTTSTTTTAPAPPPPPPVTVVQTDAALSQQLAPQPGLDFSSAPSSGLPVINVNDQVAYQRFSGLGAALTDSAAWLIYDNLSTADRTTLMEDLFGPEGIHLNFLRIGLGASGAMTTGPAYSYDDMPQGQTDPDLSNFSIAHDVPYIIPTLQQALAINPGLEILANPWSPPGWMKGNDSLGNQNDSGTLNTDDYQPLANYFVKAIQDYASEGVPIAAMTPQNEPRTTGSGTAYPGLTLPESGEAQFISQNLAPTLAAAGLHTKIYGNDLSWDPTAYADNLASSLPPSDLAGIAWHCYFGTPTAMSQLQQSSPDLDQIVDECSPEIHGFGTPEFLISTLRNWASVVSVWTVATDPNGGPIQPGNNCGGCRGLVTIDENSHTAALRTEYYQLGQVSAFVQPGAHRIDSPDFVTYGLNGSNIETVSSGLDDVAFLNPDGSKVLIVYDNSTAAISFAVQSDGRYFTYTAPAQAMTTFGWR